MHCSGGRGPQPEISKPAWSGREGLSWDKGPGLEENGLGDEQVEVEVGVQAEVGVLVV